MSKFKGLREKRRQQEGEQAAQVIDFVAEISNPVSDRMPDAVWQTIQGVGVEAVARLSELLQPERFNALNDRDKLRLIQLATDRAYGKADAGVKRTVQVNLSATGNDAVAASLERLNKAAHLPEYRDVTPATSDGTNDA